MLRQLLLITTLLFPLAVSADAGKRFIEGEHYIVLEEARSTGAAADEVEVIEFFWYGCSHCFAAERHVQRWLQDKPEKVRFLRVPATLSRGWVLMARAYYAAEQLGISAEMHDALFDAIHRERRRLNTPEDVAEVFEEVAGIDPERFRSAFQSFKVGSKLREADMLARSYPLSGVPTFVVDGRYLTTARMAGSYAGLLEVVEFLSERELDARQADASEQAADGEAGQ